MRLIKKLLHCPAFLVSLLASCPGSVLAQTGLFVDSSGNVGVGTASPMDELEVAGTITTSSGTNYTSFNYQGVSFSGTNDVSISLPGSSSVDLKFKIGSSLDQRLELRGNGTIKLSPVMLDSDTTGILVAGFADKELCTDENGYIEACYSSLKALKTEIEPYQNGLAVVRNLKPVFYLRKSGNKRMVGFLAEDVEEVEPMIAKHRADGSLYGVDYPRITAILVSAVQEQQKQIEELKSALMESAESN